MMTLVSACLACCCYASASWDGAFELHGTNLAVLGWIGWLSLELPDLPGRYDMGLYLVPLQYIKVHV